MCSVRTTCQALGIPPETKQKNNACPCRAFIQVGETNNKHVASGFENGPAACVVQMAAVSAFANTIEPNQRLFNKNNFTIISSLMTTDRLIDNSLCLQGTLKVTYYLYLLITPSAPGIALSSEHTTLKRRHSSSQQSVYPVHQVDIP